MVRSGAPSARTTKPTRLRVVFETLMIDFEAIIACAVMDSQDEFVIAGINLDDTKEAI